MTNPNSPEAVALDTESSASVQHFIETGEYLRQGEAIEAGADARSFAPGRDEIDAAVLSIITENYAPGDPDNALEALQEEIDGMSGINSDGIAAMMREAFRQGAAMAPFAPGETARAHTIEATAAQVDALKLADASIIHATQPAGPRSNLYVYEADESTITLTTIAPDGVTSVETATCGEWEEDNSAAFAPGRDEPLRHDVKPTPGEFIEAWEQFDGDDVGAFTDAWGEYFAGRDEVCRFNGVVLGDGLHTVTDGSCDYCGAKNRA